MKVGFISDIHGNYEALKAVLKDMDKSGIHQVFCLGDIVGYFCQINECCSELQKRGIECVMGNHDWYMVSGGNCPRSESANYLILYQRTIIELKNLIWLQSLSFNKVRISDNYKISMLHAGWSDPIDEYIENPTSEYFEKINEPHGCEIFVSAHTHLPVIKQWGNIMYCNCGSVGMPRDNDSRACYAVFDTTNNSFAIHRVKYDMTKLFDQMKKAGFDEYYYGCLKTGAKNLCRLDGGKYLSK